jgi:hypothetical protein
LNFNFLLCLFAQATQLSPPPPPTNVTVLYKMAYAENI